MRRITESQLRNIVRTALNEISQQAKAGGFVKANNDINRLNNMRRNGQKTYNKNGRSVDIDNEIGRRERQMRTFGQGLSHDISMEYGKNREDQQQRINLAKEKISQIKNEIAKIENGEVKDYGGYKLEGLKNSLRRSINSYKSLLADTNGYSVHALSNDGYSIQTPDGHAYSNSSGNGFYYDDSKNDSSNVNRLSKLQGITDAMMGYDEELSGKMDKELDSIRRRQNNVRALRDYDDAYARWKENDNKVKQSQSRYDNQPFFKKWFSKRPADGPQPPTKPEWIPNENGEFDGYFSHTNPEDYERDFDRLSQRKQSYKNARDKYFR